MSAVSTFGNPPRGLGLPAFFVGEEMVFGKDRLRDVEEECLRQTGS